MKKVFVAPQFNAKPKRKLEINIKRNRAFARMAILQGYNLEANPLKCQEFWILRNEDGSLSPGMQQDLEKVQLHNLRMEARKKNNKVKVRYFTSDEVEQWLKKNDPYGYSLWKKSKIRSGLLSTSKNLFKIFCEKLKIKPA